MNPSIAQPPVRREVKELLLLFAVSQILDRSMDLNEVAVPMLKAMADHMGMLRGTLTLLNRGSGEISIEAAYGLSASQQERGRYRVGEGVTGKVVQSGRPAVVPRISEEPLFLNRTGARPGGLRKRNGGRPSGRRPGRACPPVLSLPSGKNNRCQARCMVSPGIIQKAIFPCILFLLTTRLGLG